VRIYTVRPKRAECGVRRAGPATAVDLCNGMWVCNIMRWGRCVYRSVLRTSVSDYFLLRVFLRYRAYASRPTIRIQNTMLVIIVCVFNTAAGKCW
jgi:hypothetical protein